MKTRDKYLNEDKKVDDLKKELEFLKKSEKSGRITSAGRRRKEIIMRKLYSMGIYDI